MTRKSRLLAVFMTLCVVATACERDNAGTPGTESTGKDSVTRISVPGFSTMQGTVILSASHNWLFRDLYIWDLQRHEVRRLTKGARISSVDADAGYVITSNGRRQTDHIEMFADGEFRPVPGLGVPAGHTPSLSRDGVISYTQPENRQSSYTLRTWDPRSQTGEILYRSSDVLGETDWGGRGQVATVEGVGKRSRLILVKADGTKHRISPGFDAEMLQWAVGAPIAVTHTSLDPHGDVSGGFTELIDPATERRRRIQGWIAMDWSPDGQQLLVLKGKRELGLADHNGIVTSLGSLPKDVPPVGSAAWTYDDID